MGIKVNLRTQHEGKVNQCYVLVNQSGAIIKFAPTFKTKQAARRWCDRFGLAIEEPDRQQGNRQQAIGSRPGTIPNRPGGQTGQSFAQFWDWYRGSHK